MYEVNQLYACGALKVACVGLQCIGLNRELYEKVQRAQFIPSTPGARIRSPVREGGHGATYPSVQMVYNSLSSPTASPRFVRGPGPHLTFSPGLGVRTNYDTPTRDVPGSRRSSDIKPLLSPTSSGSYTGRMDSVSPGQFSLPFSEGFKGGGDTHLSGNGDGWK